MPPVDRVGPPVSAEIIRAVWTRLHQPRWVTALHLAAYTATAAVGLVLLTLPGAVTHSLGWWGTVGAGAAVTLAASTAAASCTSGVWWLERVAILTMTTAYVALLPILWSSGLATTIRVLITLQAAALIALHLARYHLIAWAYLDPAR